MRDVEAQLLQFADQKLDKIVYENITLTEDEYQVKVKQISWN